MNFPSTYQSILKKSGQVLLSLGAILCTTFITLKFGAISSAPTVAFIFLIIILLSAYFGNFLVALIGSIVATLCFDYFYLPPFGTFNITAFPDWIALAAFLLTSIIISRLTASASESREKAANQDAALMGLKTFGKWLLSISVDRLTLSDIAGECVHIFSLDYCSIHVYGEGKWHHFTGAAAGDIFKNVGNQIDFNHDHHADLSEIVDENMLGVRYAKINEGAAPQGLLAVKTDTLTTEAIEALAAMVALRLVEIIKSNKSFTAHSV